MGVRREEGERGGGRKEAHLLPSRLPSSTPSFSFLYLPPLNSTTLKDGSYHSPLPQRRRPSRNPGPPPPRHSSPRAPPNLRPPNLFLPLPPWTPSPLQDRRFHRIEDEGCPHEALEDSLWDPRRSYGGGEEPRGRDLRSRTEAGRSVLLHQNFARRVSTSTARLAPSVVSIADLLCLFSHQLESRLQDPRAQHA